MSCMSKIVAHIEATPVGQPFCTRDCLRFGSRTAVDKALCLQVKLNVIVRLAYGVFMRMEHDTPLPSIADLARIKSKAFGRDIVEYGGNLARQLGLSPGGENLPTYYINGSSSSFRYLRAGIVISLRSASTKRMHLGDSPQGKIVLALWHFGEYFCNQKLVDRAMAGNSTPRMPELLSLSKAWMPQWLAHYFPSPHVFSGAND